MQRPVEQVGDGVMFLDVEPPRLVHGDAHGFTDFGSPPNCRAAVPSRRRGLRRYSARQQHATMHVYGTVLLRVLHRELADFRAVMAWDVDKTGVANLPTRFGVERRAIENE